MKTITLTIISILLACSLFGKKPAPLPPDAQKGWHVSIFANARANARIKSSSLYTVGDDTCVVDPNSVRCGVSFSQDVFLLSNGHIIETPFDAELYISEDSDNPNLTRYSTYTFSYRLEPFTTQDILGRQITKQHLTIFIPRLNPPPKYERDIYHGVDSMFKGGFTVTIADWEQASHDLTMSDIAADILSCDDWHQKYGNACSDEEVVKILRQFVTQTPALSLVDPAFAKHDQYLSHFIH